MGRPPKRTRTKEKGISLSKARDISEEYNKQYGVRDIMLMLSKYNVTPDRCLKIFKHFGAQSVDTIKKNPYVLCEEGLDFLPMRSM